MVDVCNESRSGTHGPRREAETSVTIGLDPVAAAHLRVMAERRGMSPEDLARDLVERRLRLMVEGLCGGGEP